MISASEQEKQTIRDILRKHVPNSEVRVFGSRHTGNNKNYSDMDMVITGNFNGDALSALRCEFEESRLPYRIDVLDYRLLSEEFRKVVDSGYTVFPL